MNADRQTDRMIDRLIDRQTNKVLKEGVMNFETFTMYRLQIGHKKNYKKKILFKKKVSKNAF